MLETSNTEQTSAERYGSAGPHGRHPYQGSRVRRSVDQLGRAETARRPVRAEGLEINLVHPRCHDERDLNILHSTCSSGGDNLAALRDRRSVSRCVSSVFPAVSAQLSLTTDQALGHGSKVRDGLVSRSRDRISPGCERYARHTTTICSCRRQSPPSWSRDAGHGFEAVDTDAR